MEISISGGATTVANDTLTGRVQTAAISNGASSVAVTFSSAMLNTSYGLVTSITNTTDSTPLMPQIIHTAKSTTGFTATFNAPVDSANYKLEYIVGAHE